MPGRRAGVWLRFGVFLAVLSIAALVGRALGYPGPFPSTLYRVLDVYVEPGLAVWWFTIGGVFAGFPQDQPGYVVTIVGNVAFWLAMSYLVTRLRDRLTRARPAR